MTFFCYTQHIHTIIVKKGGFSADNNAAARFKFVTLNLGVKEMKIINYTIVLIF